MSELLQKWVSNNLRSDVAKTTRMEEVLPKAGFSKYCEGVGEEGGLCRKL